MCTSWGVQRREKISGKWKNRSVGTLQELLTNSVCLAAEQYLAASQENTAPEQRGAAEHEPSVSSGIGAAEHVAPDVLSASTGRGSLDESTEASCATQGPAKKAKTVPVSWAQLEHRAVALPETAEDVMELRRLGPDLFEATKRSGESWVGDAELLRTLPQGIARLGTLEVRERMHARKAEATRASNVSGATSARKKPRSLQDYFAEHVDRTAAAASAAQEEPSCETGAATVIASCRSRRSWLAQRAVRATSNAAQPCKRAPWRNHNNVKHGDLALAYGLTATHENSTDGQHRKRVICTSTTSPIPILIP